MSHRTTVWGVIPAAGAGQRMRSATPKQYLPLAGKPILQRSIETLLAVSGIQGVYVAMQAADSENFKQLDASTDPRVHRVAGAAQRVGSVAAAVQAVRKHAGDDAWVLIHDAARPLVALEDIHRLIDSVIAADSFGGLLATPVQDTLKLGHAFGSTGSGRRSGLHKPPKVISERTVSRENLWQAQTPQLFRSGELGEALAEGLVAMVADSEVRITDEASAFERLDRHPLLVESRHPNPKITRPSDLAQAEALLAMADAHRRRS